MGRADDPAHRRPRTSGQDPRYSVGPGASEFEPSLDMIDGSASVAVADCGIDAGEVLPTGEPASAIQIRAINYVLVQGQ